MVKTRYALCAKRVLQDTNENTISAIDLLDQIATPSFPVLIPRLSLVWSLERDGNDQPHYPASVAFLLDGVLLQEFDIEINFQASNRTRNIVGIGGIVLQNPGVLLIQFKRNNNVEAEYEVQVEAVPGVVPPTGTNP